MLYDLAFLLMDLERRGRRLSANLVLNRYLWRARSDLDLEGLAAMPLCLGLRAGVRALVAADKLRHAGGDAEAGKRAEAQDVHCRGAPLPRSGGAARGRRRRTVGHRQVDAGRHSRGRHRAVAGRRAPAQRRRAQGDAGRGGDAQARARGLYAEAQARVYAELFRKARLAATAGHGVVVDAVFARAHEREAAEAMAAELGVPFRGLWLTAPREVLLARVGAHAADASDATPDVVERQLAGDIGPMSWTEVDASGSAADTLAAARRALAS